MGGWQSVARESCPAPLTADQANAIRHAAIAAAREASMRPVRRRTPALVIGGMLATAVTGAIFVAKAQPPQPGPRTAAPAMLRQIQFATPGGTRIIWQFDPNFSLRETLP